VNLAQTKLPGQQDTSSVAMNPIIKFTTLFGLLAPGKLRGIAFSASFRNVAPWIGIMYFATALVFAW
jgi:K(+)-stimulated pyrophosphate-energized sodium pump